MINAPKVTFSGQSEVEFKKYLKSRLQGLISSLKEFHETRLPNWRRTYEAIPAEATREQPWHGASNLVVPIVAIHADTLLSRIMAAVFKTKPIWALKAIGSHRGSAEKERLALEEALGYLAMEPQELDLYRVYHDFYDDVIQYGTGIIKSPWETVTETVLVGSGNGLRDKPDFVDETKYDGPRPEKIELDDFFIAPGTKTLEACEFKAHRRRLEKWELLERRFHQVYDAAKIDAILSQPDRVAPSAGDQLKEQDAGTTTNAAYGYAEWDVFECWVRYRMADHKHSTRIIASYHLKSDTLLRAVYSGYPDDPFVAGRLFFCKGMFFGIGFCEALGQFQEECSTSHNQRIDARTIANANIVRVAPDSKLNDGYVIFPGAKLPAEKDELEVMKFGEPSAGTIEDEKLTLGLAEQRSGVTQPQQAMGSGTFSKRGVYSAMGTLSVIQEGNNRQDLNVSDCRYAHTKLGRMVAMQYARFGNDAARFEMFGEMAETIVDALRQIESKSLAISIASATASVNREVEKQNDLMLTSIMSRHYQMIAQTLQQAASPGINPKVKKYLEDSIVSADALMKSVLRNFGREEPDILVPEPQKDEPTPQAPPNANPMAGPPGGQVVPGLPSGASGGAPPNGGFIQ